MNILVRGTNWIGDAIMTIPAVRRIRAIFPDAKIVLQTRGWAEDIFNDSGLFDEIVSVDSASQQIRMLRPYRFDLAILFPNSFESALVARLGGAKKIFGYASDHRSLLLTHAIPIPEWKTSRHEVYYYLELISAVEMHYFQSVRPSGELEPRLVINEERRQAAREFLREHGVDPKLKTVAVAPGSTNSEAKRWTPASFARLNDRLHAELGVNVVILGSTGDVAVSRAVVAASKQPPLDLTGETDLAQAAAILAEADLLISNDMGLAHIAPAVGTKTIVIFGPTNPVTTRPFSDIATVVSAGVECSPCMLRECPIDHRCMTRIPADHVFEKAEAILDAK